MVHSRQPVCVFQMRSLKSKVLPLCALLSPPMVLLWITAQCSSFVHVQVID